MQSFRTELENPIVERDILELEKKIYEFRHGTLHEDSFRSLRLARGVYGQRQQGVQMIRIKLPLGIIQPNQLKRIAAVSRDYSNGMLHFTTRQDVQIHYVSLERTPELWAELEQDDITLREACGNTVRNITASPLAGIDSEEPFDVTPYGLALFRYFLRNPIGQELGRKFKIAISSSHADAALSYMHDLGLIPVVYDGIAGFKILVGGGLGAQPALAEIITDFLPAENLLKFGEAMVRVFDKLGERNKRQKARLKFLIKEIGMDAFKSALSGELSHTTAPLLEIKAQIFEPKQINKKTTWPNSDFEKWLKTNVLTQRQMGHSAVLVKIRNGNISANQADQLADIVAFYSGEAARLTVDQNLLIRSVADDLLTDLFNDLEAIGLAEYGASSVRDITSCPGTSTCNLGITATYHVSEVIEQLLVKEFNEFIFEEELIIRISGCMNSCGQHAVADIGFHGSSFQTSGSVVPALQVLLGGANKGGGNARFAEKIIKVPTKRVESVMRILLNNFRAEKFVGELFSDYYVRKGKSFFYDLLKPVADVSSLLDDEYKDWGTAEKFKTEIGVGECAGVRIDLAKTLLFESKEKLDEAVYLFEHARFPDAAYTVYSSVIQSAKTFLLKRGIETNSKEQIQSRFASFYNEFAPYFIEADFDELIRLHHDAHENSKKLLDWIHIGNRFYQLVERKIETDTSEQKISYQNEN